MLKHQKDYMLYDLFDLQLSGESGRQIDLNQLRRNFQTWKTQLNALKDFTQDKLNEFHKCIFKTYMLLSDNDTRSAYKLAGHTSPRLRVVNWALIKQLLELKASKPIVLSTSACILKDEDEAASGGTTTSAAAKATRAAAQVASGSSQTDNQPFDESDMFAPYIRTIVGHEIKKDGIIFRVEYLQGRCGKKWLTVKELARKKRVMNEYLDCLKKYSPLRYENLVRKYKLGTQMQLL